MQQLPPHVCGSRSCQRMGATESSHVRVASWREWFVAVPRGVCWPFVAASGLRWRGVPSCGAQLIVVVVGGAVGV